MAPDDFPTEHPAIASALTAWYREHGRDLPWRRSRDPYHAWVAEIMLQQTQVATVLPYYARFLEAFPTVAALAAAPQARVLKLWEGLGYYARARNLHAAAQQVVREHEGRVPDSMDAVRALPGVGRSTAGGILTFGHGQAHPLLDGNVRRVLVRLLAIHDDPRRAAVERRLWGASAALLATAADPYAFNQGLMELGALVCGPRRPACEACPIRPWCVADRTGVAAALPRPRARKAVPHHQIGVGVVRRRGRILIQRRPTEGLLGGLWEFPGGKQEPGEAIEDTVRRELAEELGLEVEVGGRIAVVDHAYSHFRITLHAYHCAWRAGQPQPTAATAVRWVWPRALSDYAVPRANRRVIEALQRGAD